GGGAAGWGGGAGGLAGTLGLAGGGVAPASASGTRSTLPHEMHWVRRPLEWVGAFMGCPHAHVKLMLLVASPPGKYSMSDGSGSPRVLGRWGRADGESAAHRPGGPPGGRPGGFPPGGNPPGGPPGFGKPPGFPPKLPRRLPRNPSAKPLANSLLALPGNLIARTTLFPSCLGFRFFTTWLISSSAFFSSGVLAPMPPSATSPCKAFIPCVATSRAAFALPPSA